jgi:hypothetical protein
MSPAPVTQPERRPSWLKWCVGSFLALFVVAIAGALVLQVMARAFARAPSIGCLQNLTSIHLAARAWADERHSNRLPTDFILFTNQIGSPKVLKCQADYEHAGISAWSDMPSTNISYVILTNGASDDSSNEYVVCREHHYAVMGDGRVSHVYKLNGTVVSTKPPK